MHLRSLGGISTIIFIQPVNDFHPFDALPHEKLDNVPQLHFHDKSTDGESRQELNTMDNNQKVKGTSFTGTFVVVPGKADGR
jgi:hypothetical protein